MSRLAGDMKVFVVLGVYRSTVKKQNKEKTLLYCQHYHDVFHLHTVKSRWPSSVVLIQIKQA